ncbi:hypothetical protein A2899_05060 [Candidatus Amesbacteria bacterium RIFCSPLOWO2_01_FULL_49_25]|nr:MAG: hypothetical protein A2899_05060 [Candidatus Amesbacteria bacterium RIFCSPLOWO2_01_FULL_49_25]
MSDQVAKLAPVIWSEIQKAKHILLHCHPNPDLDSVGSVLALKHILKKIGTSAQVISGDDPIPANTRFLPGVDQIMKSGFTEIDPKDYDLFIKDRPKVTFADKIDSYRPPQHKCWIR